MIGASSAVETFVVECEELLGQVEDTLLALKEEPRNADLVGRLFRVFHNVKGSAGMFGFEAVSSFTHRVETLLDKVRAGHLPVTGDLIESILKCKDHLEALLRLAVGDRALATAPAHDVHANTKTLEAELERFASLPPVEASPALRPLSLHLRNADGKKVDPQALADLLRDLSSLGQIASDLTTSSIDEIARAVAHEGWALCLATTASEETVRDVFIFVQDELVFSITETASAPTAPVETCGFFSDLLSAQERAALEAAEMARSVEAAAPAEVAAPVEVAPPVTMAPLVTMPRSASWAGGDSVVRVSTQKLDSLVGLVGELVISQSRLQQAVRRVRAPELNEPLQEIERLVSDLRDGVLGVRMTPIGGIFVRLKRLVHDLASQLDKDIELVTTGADTELDKTVLDKLTDPLMHLIRNAIDHGLEKADERRAAGKSERGQVKLTASQVGSNVLIIIEDDGRGLDIERIRNMAIARGLIAADAVLTSSEIHNLIMAPGLSTAREVSDISGRGVGMDVVKRQIEFLRGTVAIASTPGMGTTFTLTLPLTLAIIEGLLVEVGDERFILPLTAVMETVDLPPGDRERHNGRCALLLRDELISYVTLRDAFDIGGLPPVNEKVVVVERDSIRLGVAVDRVIGIHQTVIQPLGRLYRNVACASGATIMGDGRVALILDLSAVVASAARVRRNGYGRPQDAAPVRAASGR